MPPRPVPDALLPWALSVLKVTDNDAAPALSVVAGDASNRRYFRFTWQGLDYILAEAPPATEKNEAFLAVRKLLAHAGVRVPQVYGADLNRGFLLLEDLGDEMLLPLLHEDSVDGYYGSAFAVLQRMAAKQCAELGDYDRPLLLEELSRFPAWFVEKLLGLELDRSELNILDSAFETLVGSALEQPSVLVHRDFHSRNLMLDAAGNLAVIDFQDAVAGPVTYDLVSLLRDCYIQWPPDRVRSWALQYREQLATEGLLPQVDEEQFLRWFDWMGLQRHIKVLGTFARLYLRDGKPGYLDDLPLVIHYVLQVLDDYADTEPALGDFRDWFSTRLSPVIATQEWSRNQ